MRNYTRLVLGCALAAAFAKAADADPPVTPVVAPVRATWTPRVIATTRPVTEVEQAQPGSTLPGRPQSTDTPPLVRPVTPVEGVRPVGDTSAAPRTAPVGACLVVEKVAPPGVLPAGKPLVYDIVVRNVGSAEAQRVRVEEQVPAGAAVLTSEPRAEAHDNILSWDLGHLAAGGEARLHVALQPPADGEITTTATVTCATTSTLHARVAAVAGLAVNVRNPPTIPVGQKAIFRIEVANKGQMPLSKLLLKAKLPEGLHHTEGAEIVASIPMLAPGAMEAVGLEVVATKTGRQVVSVTASPASGGPTAAEGIIEVTAAASPAPAPVPPIVTGSPEVHPPTPAPGPLLTPTPSPLPKEPARVIPDASPIPPLPPPIPPPQTKHEPAKPAVDVGPAVTLNVADPVSALEVGGEATYEIQVLNQGTTPTRDVLVQAVLSDEMTLLGVEGPGGTLAQVDGQQVAFAPLANLDGQNRAVYRVRVKGAKPGDSRFTARLRCGAMVRPLSQEVSTRVYSDANGSGEVTQK